MVRNSLQKMPLVLTVWKIQTVDMTTVVKVNVNSIFNVIIWQNAVQTELLRQVNL